jgi:hypothetical protein
MAVLLPPLIIFKRFVMKSLMIVFLAGVSCVSAQAQIQFGVKAGANFSTLTGSGASGASTKVGFQGGVLVGIPLADAFSLQPEVNYSAQGAKASVSGESFTLTQNYLNVPVLLKYKHETGLFAETGPQIGFLMSAKASEGGNSVDVKSSYQSTDFSWAFGLGYQLKSINAGIDARYNLGLTNDAASGGGSNETVKSSVFQVGVFYLFGGK